MLEKEPLWFPSRNRFDFNPATSDRQLWAIGMVVVQWGMLEFIIEQQICDAIQGHPDLTAEYKKLRNFKQTVDLLQRLVELKNEPTRSIALRLVQRIRDLADECRKVPGQTQRVTKQQTPHSFAIETNHTKGRPPMLETR